MPSLAGAITTLGLAGVSVAAPVFDVEYQTVPRPYTQTFTQLGLDGSSVARHTVFTGKTEETLAPLAVTDSALLSATEDPVDAQTLATTDIARLSVTESVAVFRTVAGTDTALLSVTETVSLLISGVTSKPVTDTASLAATEAIAISVSVGVTDTASLSASDSAAVVVSNETLTASDTASLAATESVLVEVFTGQAPISVNDSALLAVSDSAQLVQLRPVAKITFKLSKYRMRFELL